MSEWSKTANALETDAESLKRHVKKQEYYMDNIRVGLVGMKGSLDPYSMRFPNRTGWYVVQHSNGKYLGHGDTPDEAVDDAILRR